MISRSDLEAINPQTRMERRLRDELLELVSQEAAPANEYEPSYEQVTAFIDAAKSHASQFVTYVQIDRDQAAAGLKAARAIP